MTAHPESVLYDPAGIVIELREERLLDDTTSDGRFARRVVDAHPTVRDDPAVQHFAWQVCDRHPGLLDEIGLEIGDVGGADRPEGWTIERVQAALGVQARAGQRRAELPIDVDPWLPAARPEGTRRERLCQVALAPDGRLALSSPFAAKDRLKLIRGRQWDPTRTVWFAPISEWQQVLTLADEYHMTLSPAARTAVTEARDAGIGADDDYRYHLFVNPAQTHVVYRAGYVPDVVEAFKHLEHSRAHKVRKTGVWEWWVPAEDADKVDEIARQYALLPHPAVEPILKRWVIEAEEMRALSRATDADFELPAELAQHLFGYQKAGVLYAQRAKFRTFIGDAPGLGKTRQCAIAAEVHDRWPVVVVCPTKMEIGWCREIAVVLPNRTVRHLRGQRAQEIVPADFVIVGWPNLAAWLPELLKLRPQGKILDESHYCFPGSTMIATEHGPRAIAEIVQSSDEVRVWAYDERASSWKLREVTARMRRPAPGRLVQVHHEAGRLRCTTSHPVWTEERGYVRAADLQPGDHLRLLRKERARPETGSSNGSILFGQLREHRALDWRRLPLRSGGLVTESDQSRLRMVRQAADETAGDSRMRVLLAPVLGALARTGVVVGPQSGSGGVAARSAENVSQSGRTTEDYRTTTDSRGSVRTRGDDRARHIDDSRQGVLPVAAQLVQRRHRSGGPSVGDRSGRRFAQDEEMAVFGSAQDGCPQRSRVDRVEILERGDPEPSSEGHRRDYVYNLEVEELNNYVADGVLVHNCKEGKSQRTKAAKALGGIGTRELPVKKLLELPGAPVPSDGLHLNATGTFSLNNVKEIVPQLALIHRIDDFGGHKGLLRYTRTNDSELLRELHERLRGVCFLRRRKEEVLQDLPEKLRAFLWVEPDPAVMAEYREAEWDLAEYLRKKAYEHAAALGLDADSAGVMAAMRVGGAHHLVLINVLRQLAAKSKVAAALEWAQTFLDGSDESLLIFAHHRAIVDAVAEELHATKIQGGMTAQASQTVIDRFQAKQDRACVLSITAAGVGITLTAASNELFLEQAWNPATLEQAESRAHRIGTVDTVTAFYMLAENTIDVEITSLLERKRQVVDAITDGRDVDNWDPDQAEDPEAIMSASGSIAGDLIEVLTRRALNDAPVDRLAVSG